MSWFKKKADPISDRARALNEEIAQLEAQIKVLDARVQEEEAQPRLRSTVLPHGETLSHPAPRNSHPPAQEPIFEEVRNVASAPDPATTPEHYNDLGVRKYDLPALLRRIRNQFQGPSTTNPKLVSYLAAGGIQGLRPLRYEKRVARNRFIFFVFFLFLVLLGLVLVFAKRH
ncbi:MAG: hypothetical protein C5B50_18520 [Verrucomicrobia bacterium]|nr:MAG: hypothetical protein C5B50_18520 [Verrucomicrobiota bacterium]